MGKYFSTKLRSCGDLEDSSLEDNLFGSLFSNIILKLEFSQSKHIILSIRSRAFVKKREEKC
jgi:hypothetical protein